MKPYAVFLQFCLHFRRKRRRPFLHLDYMIFKIFIR